MQASGSYSVSVSFLFCSSFFVSDCWFTLFFKLATIKIVISLCLLFLQEQLDQIWTIGKTSLDNYGLEYQNEIALSSNTIFVKASQPRTKLPLPMAKLLNEVEHKYVAYYTSSSHGKFERFVSTRHFYHVKGYIWPRCFKLMKSIKKLISSNLSLYDKSGYASNSKLKCKGNFTRQIWIRKSGLKAYLIFISLRACTNNF